MLSTEDALLIAKKYLTEKNIKFIECTNIHDYNGEKILFHFSEPFTGVIPEGCTVESTSTPPLMVFVDKVTGEAYIPETI